jgi:two-component system response regulator PrrA
VAEADVRPVVLVVDDEPMIRDVLEQYLTREGFEVLTASNGAEALALCRAQPGRVALALLDVRLPVLDGAETMAALRAVDPGVPCCLLGAFVEDAERERLLALGAVAVLAKPFDFRTLAETLRGRLKGR